MRPGAALAELASLWRVSGRAAAGYGEPRLRAARRARRMRVEGAWTYEEALAEGILDPALPDDVRRRHRSKHAREEIQKRFGPYRLDALTEEKLTFYRYCEALGIPVPALYGTVGDAGTWSAATGRLARGAEAFARLVNDELPPAFVVKPVDGYLGWSVHALERDGGLLREADGRALSPEDLHAELVADPEFGLFLVQERLYNHPALERLRASPTLQSLRMVTLMGRDGVPRLMAAWLKVTLAGGARDNYEGGTSGNGMIEIDPAAGRMRRLVFPREDGVGTVQTTTVPGTGAPLAGEPTPLFDDARRLVLDAAPHFLPIRSLGWDVALTPDGARLIETNNFWGHAGLPMNPELVEALARP